MLPSITCTRMHSPVFGSKVLTYHVIVSGAHAHCATVEAIEREVKSKVNQERIDWAGMGTGAACTYLLVTIDIHVAIM